LYSDKYRTAQSSDSEQDFAPQQCNRKEEMKKATESFSSFKDRGTNRQPASPPHYPPLKNKPLPPPANLFADLWM